MAMTNSLERENVMLNQNLREEKEYQMRKPEYKAGCEPTPYW
jgi:hypothetical protein